MSKKVVAYWLVCILLGLCLSFISDAQYLYLYEYAHTRTKEISNKHIRPYVLDIFNISDRASSKALPSESDIVKVKSPRKGLLNVGHAVYGFTSDSFDCNHFFKIMKKVPEWHISYVYNTFGNNLKCIKRFFDEPKARTVQVHLVNEASPRSGNAQWYEFHKPYSLTKYNELWEKNDKNLLSKFSEYVKPLQELFESYLPSRPHIRCIISPGLESNVGEKAARNMVEAVRREFPYCKVSWNGMKATAWNADFIEKHSANPNVSAPCIIDLDGQDVDFPQRRSAAINDGIEWTTAVSTNNLRVYIERLANKCELYYVWAWESNCSISGSKRDPNQRNRNCSHPQVNLVLRLLAKEIRWANKRAVVSPEVYNWSYDESLPLQLCSTVKNKPLRINTARSGGRIKVPSSYALQSLYVMYKQDVIDVYTLATDDGTTQIWASSIKPKKKYPFKTVLVGVGLQEEGITGTICWKINNPAAK